MTTAGDFRDALGTAESPRDLLLIGLLACERIAALEAELAQLKQPAHVLAEAERLVLSVSSDGMLDVHFRIGAVVISPWSDAEARGTTLAEAYAKLRGGRDV